MITSLRIALLAAGIALTACTAPLATDATARHKSFLELPANAAPHPRLAPLSFLSGRWICVNPNDTVNEEHWMPPRGRFMIGAFRQVRLDGMCSLVEVTQIALEDDEIVLRLRHMHGRMEVPEDRLETDVFRLKSLTDTRVEFAGTGEAEGVNSVVYELRSPNELVQSIGFDAEKTQQQPFVSVYRRAMD